MGVEVIGVVVKRNRLRWFGHVERKDDCHWVKGCTVLEVEGLKPRGIPKKTWMEVVKRDMKEMGLRREDVLDRVEWRRRLKGGDRPTWVNLETGPLKRLCVWGV